MISYHFEISVNAMKEMTNALAEVKSLDYNPDSAAEAHERIDKLVSVFSRLLTEAERFYS